MQQHLSSAMLYYLHVCSITSHCQRSIGECGWQPSVTSYILHFRRVISALKASYVVSADIHKKNGLVENTEAEAELEIDISLSDYFIPKPRHRVYMDSTGVLSITFGGSKQSHPSSLATNKFSVFEKCIRISTHTQGENCPSVL